jgi:hypothetical protein
VLLLLLVGVMLGILLLLVPVLQEQGHHLPLRLADR